MGKVKTSISYEKGMIIRDDKTLEVFRVISCVKDNEGYLLELDNITGNKEQENALKDLKTAINGLKIHDKDLFMLENIISTLEDTI